MDSSPEVDDAKSDPTAAVGSGSIRLYLSVSHRRQYSFSVRKLMFSIEFRKLLLRFPSWISTGSTIEPFLPFIIIRYSWRSISAGCRGGWGRRTSRAAFQGKDDLHFYLWSVKPKTSSSSRSPSLSPSIHDHSPHLSNIWLFPNLILFFISLFAVETWLREFGLKREKKMKG